MRDRLEGWRKGRGDVSAAGEHDWTDDELVALIEAVSVRPGTKIGIDCPFGWPAAFLRLVASQAGDAPFAVPQSTIEVTSSGCPAKLAATR